MLMVLGVMEKNGTGTCWDRLRDFTCLLSTLQCNFLPESVGICHSFRHLIQAECLRESGLTSILDFLFSSRLKDTQCIDERFKYHLNAPRRGTHIFERYGQLITVDCQADDYIMNVGHCRHKPDGTHSRQVTYSLVSGVVCRQGKSLSIREQPCDCTPADLRQIQVPVGIKTCQRIVYIRPDPDCTTTDYYEAYKSYEDDCTVGKPNKGIFFLNDWNFAFAKATLTPLVKINNITTTCQRIPCLENERPESIPEVDYSIYRYQNCSITNSADGVACPSWRITRDNVILTPVGSDFSSKLSLLLEVSIEIYKPMMVFRMYSDGPLREADRIIVRVDGVEVYQWTAVENRQVLGAIPFPAIPLPNAPVDISFELVRPYLPFRDRNQISTYMGAKLYLESLAIMSSTSMASNMPFGDGARGKSGTTDGASSIISKIIGNSKTIIIIIAAIPLLLVFIILWRFVLMLVSHLFCGRKKSPSSLYPRLSPSIEGQQYHFFREEGEEEEEYNLYS